MATNHFHAEPLEMPMTDLDLGIAEVTLKAALQDLPGIRGVLLVGRGVFIRYNPKAINGDQICLAARQTGYRPIISQESSSLDPNLPGRAGR